jgi:type 2 lantibiotic biosynthesis protein LanM
MLTSRDLTRIAGHARFLWERLATTPPHEAVDATAATHRVARWRARLARPDRPDALEVRLSIAGLSAAHLARLEDGDWPADRPLPAWSHTLHEAFAGPRLVPSSIAAPHAPRPFEEILFPLVDIAARRLRERTGAAGDHLTVEALRGWRRHLLERLSDLAAPSLLLSFRREVARRDPLALFTAPGERASRRHYEPWVSRLREGKLAEFFTEYAALARLLAEELDRQVAAATELCRRLDADWVSVADLCGCGAPGRVTQLAPSGSDPHSGGQRVMILHFESGDAVVYKPRTVSAEVAYAALVSWATAAGIPHGLRAPRALARPGYGWVEAVRHHECRDEAEVRAYYLRAGVLAALLYAVGTTDAHHENLIAEGAMPVLIDPEVLLSPPTRTWGNDPVDVTTVGATLFRESVLGTGLFPMWTLSGAGHPVDVGGLGGQHGSGAARLMWRDVNTDAMSASPESQVAPARNLPWLRGRPVGAERFEAEIIRGFEDGYRFLLDHRAGLTGPAGPMRVLGVADLRFLFRNTGTYADLLSRMLHPSCLGSGADMGIEAEALAVPFIPAKDAHATPPVSILHAELEAMARLDIPTFSARADSCHLYAGNAAVATDVFLEPATAALERRLARLGEPDLRFQRDLIQAAMAARFADTSRDQRAPRRDEEEPVARIAARSAETARAAALRIGHEAVARAIHAPDRTATWLGFGFDHASGTARLEPLADDLYGGRPGVALLLAALAAETGDRPCADAARAALAPWTRPEPPHARPGDGPTGLGGAGGLFYALTRAGSWLGDPRMLSAARGLVATLAAPPRTSSPHDVIEGDAGALLALLAFHAVTADGSALDAAIACGDRLLSARQGGQGLAWWPSWPGHPAYPGMAHGAAGIALALARLFARTDDARYSEAAAAAYTWAAREYDGGPDFGTSWCHGQAGWVLARLGGAELVGLPAGIDEAIHRLRHGSASTVDHLCCGGYGTVEALALAGRRLGRDEASHAALSQATRGVNAPRSPEFVLDLTLPDSLPHFGFFRGVSGIAYVLLRLGGARDLPSVLLVE